MLRDSKKGTRGHPRNPWDPRKGAWEAAGIPEASKGSTRWTLGTPSGSKDGTEGALGSLMDSKQGG